MAEGTKYSLVGPVSMVEELHGQAPHGSGQFRAACQVATAVP